MSEKDVEELRGRDEALSIAIAMALGRLVSLSPEKRSAMESALKKLSGDRLAKRSVAFNEGFHDGIELVRRYVIRPKGDE